MQTAQTGLVMPRANLDDFTREVKRGKMKAGDLFVYFNPEARYDWGHEFPVYRVVNNVHPLAKPFEGSVFYRLRRVTP